MRANPTFAGQTVSFWAYVRAITEALGYSRRGADRVSSFTIHEMTSALRQLERSADLLGSTSEPSPFATTLKDYFDYRAEILNDQVRADLMLAQEAEATFERVLQHVRATSRREVLNRDGVVTAVDYRVRQTSVRVPMNKQTGAKRAVAFLTGIVNLLIAHGLDGRPCDYDPRKIPVIDHEGALYAALSRRMDGSYPSTTNPIAMWEIKEYYYTTTFGSKISDAVYITSLDGYERLEIERATGIRIEHLVMVDAYDTWWGKGKSYLCRMIDVLNMGHVDELLFGGEVVRRIPDIVAGWVGRDVSKPSSTALAVSPTDLQHG